MSCIREAMIVAGGQGTRLRPLTLTTPKPLLGFCGRPFLSGVIRRLSAEGIDKVLLVVGADTAPFEVLVADAAAVGVEIEMVPEPTPLDTAGGVRSALGKVSGPFLVLNGDILSGLELGQLMARHLESGAAATLSLTRVEDTSTFGVCLLEGDTVVGFVEKPAAGTLSGHDTVNAGTYVLEPSAMDRFPIGPLSFEREVFPQLVAEGADVHGVVSSAPWMDLGTPRRFLDGHRLVLDGEVSWPVGSPVVIDGDAARQRTDVEVAVTATIRGPVQLGPGTRLAEGAVIGPYAVLGASAHVAAGARVRDSVLFDRCQVGQEAQIDGSLVGSGVRIGAAAMVSTGCVVGDGQQIADRQELAPGSRVPDTETNAQ